MRYLVIGMLLLLLLAWLGPADNPASTSAVGHALAELLAALGEVLRWYAILDHALQERLWRMLAGDLLPLLGALKCLNLFLTLLGLYALGILGRFRRWVI